MPTPLPPCPWAATSSTLEFDPLPLDVSTITYVEPDGEPFNAWGANWTGSVKPDISVQELRDNQRLFEYYPRVVVK